MSDMRSAAIQHLSPVMYSYRLRRHIGAWLASGRKPHGDAGVAMSGGGVLWWWAASNGATPGIIVVDERANGHARGG